MVHWLKTGQEDHPHHNAKATMISNLTTSKKVPCRQDVYERPRFRGVVYTDMMHGHFKSLDGNLYAQVFATEDFFAAAYPMESKSMAGDALKEFTMQRLL